MKKRGQFRDQKFIESIANRFVAICKEKGITHEKLSANTGLETRQIGRILRGETNFSISQFALICKGLDSKPSEVLKGIEC